MTGRLGGVQITPWSGSRDLIELDVARRLGDMTALSAELFAGSEAREGMAAFAERRTPSWVPGAAGLPAEPAPR